MQGVFNPNILIYHPPNSAEGLHFSAFHYNRDFCIIKKILRIICTMKDRSFMRVAQFLLEADTTLGLPV